VRAVAAAAPRTTATRGGPARAAAPRLRTRDRSNARGVGGDDLPRRGVAQRAGDGPDRREQWGGRYGGVVDRVSARLGGGAGGRNERGDRRRRGVGEGRERRGVLANEIE
jgi:hypothetical protein